MVQEIPYTKLLTLEVFMVIGLNTIPQVMLLADMLNALMMNIFGSNSMISGLVTMYGTILMTLVEVHKTKILSYYKLLRS